MREPCKACGCPIEKVYGPNGKFIPLDMRAPTYWTFAATPTKENPSGVVAQKSAAHVSHFATCSDPKRFSASRKKP